MEKKKFSKIKKQKRPVGIFNNVFFYILALFVGYIVFGTLTSGVLNKETRSINKALTDINEGKVRDLTISGDNIDVLLKDGTSYLSQKESGISFDQMLVNNGIDRSKITGEVKVEHTLTLDQILTPLISIGLPLFILYFIFKQMKGAGNELFSFGKSRARIFNKGASKITFKDVAGNEEAKKEMMEIVDFLKSPEKFRKLGARTPKGVLLIGPAGVGKTLLAKAIAGEANVPFFSVAGSEFMEMLVGVGSARARDLFAMAKQSQPSLIFIDEIDAIGRQRGMGIGGGHDEREQTLNQILTEMDGFDTRTDVIVIAATNRPDMLDPALIRPGRFDRRITVPLPDLKDREAIIKLHMQGKPVAKDVDVERFARKTVGFSGADLENMLNEAAILAARLGRSEVISADLEEASLKVTLGSERRTLQNDEEKSMTAYHEAGHAMVALFMPEMDEVSRISIVARGGSLGHTSFPPERDRYNETQTHLTSLVTTMLGGRAAEELIFNEFTVGASDDISRATLLVRKMVTEYGMSSLGPVAYKGREGNYWIARDIEEGSSYSEEVAAKIDAEVKKIIDASYSRAKETLTTHKDYLTRVAQRLLEKETIDGGEFKSLLDS